MQAVDGVALAGELLAAYDDKLRRRQGLTARARVHPHRLIAAYGLTAQAYDVGQDALELIRQGRQGGAAPLVRVTFECAVHGQWLVRVPEATDALIAEAHRQEVALATNMAKTARFLRHAPAVRAAAGPAPAAAPTVSARQFEQICNQVDPDGTLYVMYRTLSAGAHVGMPVIARWFEEIDVPPYIAWRPDPGDLTSHRSEMLSGTLALSLLWAGAALDVMLRTRPLARKLNAVGGRLGYRGTFGKLVLP
jgi:hypothetical protein